jgi:hypothetical protein
MDIAYRKLIEIDRVIKHAEKVMASGRCNWANLLYELVEDINKIINPVEPIEEVTNAPH